MKALSEILHGKRQDPILENSDEELEAALADEEPSSEGDVALVMARMSDIIDMADDLYNTVSELESVDGDTEAAAVSAYNALDDLYAAIKDRYEITTSEYDFDADGSDDLEESKTISEDRVGRSYWIAKQNYVADLGQIKRVKSI